MAEVRSSAGVPAAAAFGGLGAPSLGTPLVVDSSTGDLYTLIGGVSTRSATVSLRHGSGVPDNAVGSNGDFYFRSNGSAGAYIYFKAAGSWGVIV